MDEMVTVWLLGKEYRVPAALTIMDAMEYAGFKLRRGVGCRSGFCGACAVIYRIQGTTELKVVLACQTKIEAGMCVGKIDSFPIHKRTFSFSEIRATDSILGQLYPEIYSCIGCNACTKGCPQGIRVMQYIAYAQRGDIARCAETSFDCVACNICASRCPSQISHSAVGQLARRLYGAYVAPACAHLDRRVAEVTNGVYDAELARLKALPEAELQELYNRREVEQ